ncbi:unnamed protein product [Tuber melanosporum]|uniref:Large ribosomal subunit protein bL28m n=1 Tax=Tuber melanosporum (strain Mel28) TaxID=656061 RepID=D5GE37_TUBMM|nr:uncharacterized protein GSTUM_00006361001 [Tuber melanosporum]CAZ82780.1 unnamed protein product [Tuber melanosporum]
MPPLSFSLPQFLKGFVREFHSTPLAAAKPSRRRLEHILRNVPKYPYPIKHTFKQSWFGLYGGKHIQFGNNVPENFLRYKTRRQWMPNVRHRSVYSRALGMHFSLDITTSVLRTIDKVGGLDAYLTGTKPARLKELGPTGWRLRWRVLNSPNYQRRLQAERKALGLLDGQEPVFPGAGSAPAPAGANHKLRGLLEDAFIGGEERVGGEGEEEIAVVAPKKAKPISAGKELISELERASAQRGGGSRGKKV